jgi:uncharacterized membrane protein YhhN
MPVDERNGSVLVAVVLVAVMTEAERPMGNPVVMFGVLLLMICITGCSFVPSYPRMEKFSIGE